MIASLRECLLEVCPAESAPRRLTSINVDEEKPAKRANGDHWRLADWAPFRSVCTRSGSHVLELAAEVTG
jgi:hypothetical protein